jgi:hypothetical protein
MRGGRSHLRLEASISALCPDVEAVREMIFSATERELALVALLQQLNKLGRKAPGWKLKAQRQE